MQIEVWPCLDGRDEYWCNLRKHCVTLWDHWKHNVSVEPDPKNGFSGLKMCLDFHSEIRMFFTTVFFYVFVESSYSNLWDCCTERRRRVRELQGNAFMKTLEK